MKKYLKFNKEEIKGYYKIFKEHSETLSYKTEEEFINYLKLKCPVELTNERIQFFKTQYVLLSIYAKEQEEIISMKRAIIYFETK